MISLLKLVLFVISVSFLVEISLLSSGNGQRYEYIFVISVWIQFDYCFETGIKRQETADLANLTVINFRSGFRSAIAFLGSVDNFQEDCPGFYYVCGNMVLVPNMRQKTVVADEQVSVAKQLAVYLEIFLEGIYTGYFGAGGGVVLLTLLIVNAFAVNNTLKNFTLAFANVIGAVVYLFKMQILWKYVMPLAVGL